jgi:lysophospholipase L1-like esterase
VIVRPLAYLALCLVAPLGASCAQGAPDRTASDRTASDRTATAVAPPSWAQWEGDIRRFEEADRLRPPPRGAVLFVGSSSIRFWESAERDFPGVPIVRRGFGGSEMGDVLHYADRVVLPYAPRTIVLYAGDNDLGAGRTPEQVFDDYRRFVELVRARLPETRVAFIAVKPSLARWSLVDSIRRTNALVKEYAAHDPRRLVYVDVFTPMLDASGRPRRELFREDGLHMTAPGYALWTELLTPYLR